MHRNKKEKQRESEGGALSEYVRLLELEPVTAQGACGQ